MSKCVCKADFLTYEHTNQELTLYAHAAMSIHAAQSGDKATPPYPITPTPSPTAPIFLHSSLKQLEWSGEEK